MEEDGIFTESTIKITSVPRGAGTPAERCAEMVMKANAAKTARDLYGKSRPLWHTLNRLRESYLTAATLFAMATSPKRGSQPGRGTRYPVHVPTTQESAEARQGPDAR